VKEHLHFVVNLLVAPDFKRMINWLSLKREDVTLKHTQIEDANLRNFIILTALKIQSLMGDLEEAQELNQSLKFKHRHWKEKELETEI